jgi:hypothetical protein
MTEVSLGVAVRVWKLAKDVRLDSEDWNEPSALDRLPNADTCAR